VERIGATPVWLNLMFLPAGILGKPGCCRRRLVQACTNRAVPVADADWLGTNSARSLGHRRKRQGSVNIAEAARHSARLCGGLRLCSSGVLLIGSDGGELAEHPDQVLVLQLGRQVQYVVLEVRPRDFILHLHSIADLTQR
jgi:hypothetical protein